MSIKNRNTVAVNKNKDSQNLVFKILKNPIFIVVFAIVVFSVAYYFVTKPPKEDEVLTIKSQTPPEYKFSKEGMLVLSDPLNKPKMTIDIELADIADKRTLGLMFRKEIGDKQGMLFVFPDETIQSFWMKNTYIPLDMMFINSKSEIVTIHKNTVPHQERPGYSSTAPSQYVLEVKGGFCDINNIKVGDKISWQRME